MGPGLASEGTSRHGWGLELLLTFPARTRSLESGSSRGIRDLGERWPVIGIQPVIVAKGQGKG